MLWKQKKHMQTQLPTERAKGPKIAKWLLGMAFFETAQTMVREREDVRNETVSASVVLHS